MKRTLVGAAVAVAAVTAAGIAVAHGVDGGKSVKSVTGGFNATTASKVTTRTCTTSDNKTVVTTDGTYTGTATGDPDLTGNVTVRARSTVNSTDNVGVVTGRLKIDVASGRDSEADFTATWASNQFAGLAVGHAHDPAAKLIANVSGGFTATGGFTNAKIGGTAGGGAVELLPTGCASTKTVREHSEARGTVSANGNGSITVAGLTCTVPASLQAKVAGVPVNSHAAIRCELVNGTNTLTSVEKLH
jgi:uncharacterized protein with FMN-binding domain